MIDHKASSQSFIPVLPRRSELATLEQYSFSDEAAQCVGANVDDLRIRYCDTIGDVWAAIKDGANALIPYENASGGVVWKHLDRLSEEPVSIVGEVNLKVRMCVGRLGRDDLEGVKRVYSHPKGLEQCEHFVQGHSLSTLEFPSTISAARAAAADEQAKSVALASRRAIEAAGLTVVETDVADCKGEDNVTQFFIVQPNGHRDLPDPQSIYHASIVRPENDQGVLADILAKIKEARVDLSSIQSRISGRKNGKKQYGFFLEMQRLGTPEEFQKMVDVLAKYNPNWLGSWDKQFEN